MYCKVKVLRHRGARRNQHEISADPGTDGDLTLARVGATLELKLAAADDSQQQPIVPVLYDAQLVTMQGNKMLFAGLQRENGIGYEQEWSVMVLRV
jgi:hypothetical protein